MLRSVEAQLPATENSRQYGAQDLYIRGPRRMAAEPRRVVVELTAQEFQALEAACRGRCITAPELAGSSRYG